MDRGSRPVLNAAWVVGLVLLLLAAGAAPAGAAFSGRNGLLVVQPPGGGGLIVVGADGADPHQICTIPARCDGARDPVWSRDGSEIAYAAPAPSNGGREGSQPYVIYPDGSCLACPVPAPSPQSGNLFVDSWDPAGDPGFLPDGRLAVSVDVGYPPAPKLGAVDADGIGFEPFTGSGRWQQPAWSPSGQFAGVRRVKRRPEVFVVDPRTGSARRLTRVGASSPSWSPTGRRLAVVHRGWIDVIGSGGGRMRRLTRGRAPAWAPGGKQLAFIGADDRVFVIAARGGRARRLGQVRAVRVDWQPVIGKPPTPCQAPVSSTVVATSPDARVSTDPAPIGPQPPEAGPTFSVLGCLTSDGHERLLESMPPSSDDDAFGVGVVALAGDYAALVNETTDIHYGPSSDTVTVFDLRTATTVDDRGGESANCFDYEGFGCISGVDQVVLGADAVSAADTLVSNCLSVSSCTTVEEIVANDSTGTHTLDSITTTGPYNPTPSSSLTQLALSGHTLTWTHGGSPRSAQLN